VAGQTEIGVDLAQGLLGFLRGPLLEGPLHPTRAGRRLLGAKLAITRPRAGEFEHQFTDQVAQGRLLERDVRPGRRPAGQWHPILQQGLAAALETLRRANASRGSGRHPPRNKQHPPGKIRARQRPESVFPQASLEPTAGSCIPVWAAAYRHCCC